MCEAKYTPTLNQKKRVYAKLDASMFRCFFFTSLKLQSCMPRHTKGGKVSGKGQGTTGQRQGQGQQYWGEPRANC